MPEMDKEEFKFPDEVTQESKGKPEDDGFEIEIEDDTPADDKDRKPMPANLKEELEKDELEEYDEGVKVKLKQMKKVWHDERREKERIARENAEAVVMLQRLMDENKKYRELIQTGSKQYATSLENAATLELEAAKRKYKEAYESGDPEQVAEAAQAMNAANLKAMQAKNFKAPPLQPVESQVQIPTYEQQNPQNSRERARLEAWQRRNDWYGKDEEMTAAALGLHEKLVRQGDVVIGSEAYYRTLDKTMRKRFPEQFEDSQFAEDTDESDQNDEEKVVKAKPAPTKPSTVVAPVMRSTASKKVKLKQSTMDLIKRLNITPEQYVREQLLLESKNG